jgi:tagaturonate reductase
MILSREALATISSDNWILPSERVFQLPEKVLQFGTGVLLRGLPDYFINKANNQGIFNGRVVIVKSTSSGGTNEFAQQDSLYTHCVRGIQNGQKVEENIINASVSRVLSAKDEWSEILKCAENQEMEVVISNTTEVGITLKPDDNIHDAPPVSFPGKLVAFLYKRFSFFNGDESKGMVIVPTELIPQNGKKLKAIILELAGKS